MLIQIAKYHNIHVSTLVQKKWKWPLKHHYLVMVFHVYMCICSSNITWGWFETTQSALEKTINVYSQVWYWMSSGKCIDLLIKYAYELLLHKLFFVMFDWVCLRLKEAVVFSFNNFINHRINALLEFVRN